MNPKRIAVKFFASPDPGPDLDLRPAIDLFHTFIQEKTLEGLLIDVADYAHVPEGPGVVLIGHEVDYGIDRTGGRTGLLVTRKRCEETDLGEALRDTIRKGLGAIKAIEANGALGVTFAPGAFTLQVFDRLAAPNTDAGYAALSAAVAPALKDIFGDGKVEIARAQSDDARRALALSVSGPAPSL
ncbi:MAG: hypothetical protein ACE5FC_09205 [Myxococcota bacterium]